MPPPEYSKNALKMLSQHDIDSRKFSYVPMAESDAFIYTLHLKNILKMLSKHDK